MQKAKIILVVVSTLSITGGALAYKATRSINIFYLDTTAVISGEVRNVCTKQTSYLYTYNPFGTRTIKASIQPTDMTCPVISVVDWG